MILNLIFWAFAALCTGGVYLLGAPIAPWWALLILPASYVGAVILFFIFLGVCVLFLPKREPVTTPKLFCVRMIRITMDWVMLLLRVRVTVKGLEKLPNEPCILVSNHRSGFDPMTVLASVKGKRIAFISKEANLKIPIVGNFIHHACFLAIDRGNGMRALRTIKFAAEMVKNNNVDVMGIYPEGTRSKTGELLRFKSGAFLLAKRADAPIAVMMTRGTERVFRNFPFRATHVEIEILDVIAREEVAALEHDELSTRTRAMIEQALG
jgi:1-acyl-sn-glycerol-3-phosphate acyltransferase